MKGMKSILAATALIALIAAPAYAQMSGSKSSAAVSTATILSQTDMTHSWDTIMTTYIKVPQDKELIFDVALECGLFTDTLVRSKGGTKDTSTAEAAVKVRVKTEKLDNNGDPIDGTLEYAYPGGEDWGVTYCKRSQELMGKFQGIFQECTEWAVVTDENGNVIIDPETGDPLKECVEYGASCLKVTEDKLGNHTTTLDMSCLQYEEVQLVLDTLSANAFNFVSPNLTQGEYMVTVEAEISSNTTETNGEAVAKGMIGLGSIIVDEVRFTQATSESDPFNGEVP